MYEYDDATNSMVCLCSRPLSSIPPYLGGSVDIMVVVGGIYLHM
jgi:hypothetical protein